MMIELLVRQWPALAVLGIMVSPILWISLIKPQVERVLNKDGK